MATSSRETAAPPPASSTGTIESTTVNDPGLSTEPLAPVPALTPLGFALLASLFIAAGAALVQRRGRRPAER
jgi:hypothetical protein